jgi:hypothetical protein
MDRRTFLRLGIPTGAVVLTGCTAGEGPAGDGDDVTTTEPPTTSPPETNPPDEVELQESSFDVTAITGSGTPGAAVTFDAGATAVRVIGTIRGNDGCKTGALEGVDYDRAADVLTVSVVTRDKPDAADVCTQQLVYVSYDAGISFAGGLPGRAVVVHDGSDVAIATRESVDS